MSRFADSSFMRRRRQQARVFAASTFAIGVVGGALLGFMIWQHRAQWPDIRPASWTRSGALPADLSPTGRYVADVLRVNDGDTFEARVHLKPGQHLITRVRLRGIDTAELNARCVQEYRLAEAAQKALRAILAERQVSIWNIGPDKYYGRVVAEVGTRTTPDVSAAMLAKGVARRYDGGRREGWC
jgi:endonuclease YncB( thermonuclease family)